MPFTSSHMLAPYAKSITAAVVTGLSSLYQALDGDGHVTGQEWVAVAMATVTALGVVFAVPNKDKRGEHQDESVQPPNPEADDDGVFGEH